MLASYIVQVVLCSMHLFIMLQSLLLFRVNQSNRDVLPIGVPVPFRPEFSERRTDRGRSVLHFGNGNGPFHSERRFRTAKLPKKAAVPHFFVSGTARPFQIRVFRNGNAERPFRSTRSVPDGVPDRNWVTYSVAILGTPG